MPDSPAKFFLTTPIYYVNARPHIGHAYTTIVADVLARRSRAQGTPTWFLTGTDEHGQKIERSAQAAGIPPQAFADEVSQSFQTLWQRMGITNDQFIRTTDPAHKRGVQKLFADLHARGQIYLSSYTGQYSIGEEMFVEGPPGTLGPDGKPTETVTEENFFFRLSDYQLPLLDLIESDTLKITPEARKNEVLSFLRGPIDLELNKFVHTPEHRNDPDLPDEDGNRQPIAPIGPTIQADTIELMVKAGKLERSAKGNPYVPGALRDLSVSRSSFTWGIPVPEPAASEAKEKHVIYVWLDALANYMTALGYGSDDLTEQAHFQKFWPADLHLVGKEIIRFHCVYWPAFLLALNPQMQHAKDEPAPILSFEEHAAWASKWLPKAVTAHGWLLFDDSKMSKSKGNIVRTETILSAFGTLCPPPSPSNVVVKDTPSGVPPQPPGDHPASAAEVRSPIPATEPLRAPFISQPHREMSGNSEASPTPTGAPSSDDGGAVEHAGVHTGPPLSGGVESGVSDEARPLSSTSATSPGAPSSTDGLFVGQGGVSDEVRPSSPASPTPHQRDLFAADVLRYFLLREIPFGQDGSFTFDALITRYNADLANGYGNLVSRTLKLIETTNEGIIPNHANWSETTVAIAGERRSDGRTGRVRGLFTTADIHLARLSTVVTTFYPEAFAALRFSMNLDFAQLRRDLLESADVSDDSRGALDYVSLLIDQTNDHFSLTQPWKLAKQPGKEARLADALYTAAESIRIITALLHPILPYATASVWRQLGLGDIELSAKNGDLKNLTWGGLQPGTRLGPLAPIFPRADKGLAQIMADIESTKNDLKSVTDNADATTPTHTEFKEAPIASLTGQRHETPSPEPKDPTDPAAGPRTSTFAEPNPGLQVAGSSAHTPERPGTPSHTEAPASGIFSPAAASRPADASPQITIDDFAKVELRVAKILVCERIPKADKLLRLEVDLGYEQRQILSGIAEWYTPEDLIGRRIVVITNLAPRKMRGLESHGMLLAASTEGGKPHLATFAGADDLPLGSHLK